MANGLERDSGPYKVIRQGPLLVWNGQERIASITNKAGVWPHGTKGGDVCHMFDENLETFWHSGQSTVNVPKIIKIEFKVSHFSKLSLKLKFFRSMYKIFRKPSILL